MLTTLIAGVDLLDELNGVGFVGAPELQASFGLTYRGAAVALFFMPQLCGLLLEPPFFVLADRWRRRPLVIGGLLTLGACQMAAGLTHSLVTLLLFLALAGPASGIGVGLAQAALISSDPDRSERWMARWTLMGHLGDLGTPLLFAALSALSLGWRQAFLATSALTFAYALLLALLPFPEASAPAERDSRERPGSILGSALAQPRLVLWLGGVALCSLLDETFVAFAALRFDQRYAADGTLRALALAAFVAGGVLGLLATERLLLSVAALRLALLSAVGCALAYSAWLGATAHSAPGFVTGVLLCLVGMLAAPLYPIAKAQAYRSLPGRPGMVNAVGKLFDPLELALPLVLGLVADRLGLGAALWLLLLQPLGVLAIVLRAASIQTPPASFGDRDGQRT